MTAVRDVSLFIDPFSHHFWRDELFNVNRDTFGGDNVLRPYVYLSQWFRERGVQTHTADWLVRGEKKNKVNVYLSLGIQQNCRRLAERADVIMSAFFAFESPVVEPELYANLSWVQRYFKRIYTFTDSAALKPFLRSSLPSQTFRIPQSYNDVDEAIWRRCERKFLVMINTNRLPRLYWNELYTERMRAIEFFSRTGDLDLYGVGWEVPSYRPFRPGTPYIVQRIYRMLLQGWQRLRPDPLLQAARRVWRGRALNKAEILGQYTFSIVFENTILKGWITEKIFDCFHAGTIPIYWGAPDVQEHIPPACFIDMRRFGNYEELRRYLKSLSPREIQTYKENARSFYASEQFKVFSKETFVERCAQIIEEDTGVRIA